MHAHLSGRFNRIAIPCEQCGRHFLVPLSRSLRRFCSRACWRGQWTARDGDKKRARWVISNLIKLGRLPHPDALPCADCGHVWRRGESRHEYDHHLGYDLVHHADVQPVCSHCHHAREAGRGVSDPQFLARFQQERRAALPPKHCANCHRFKPPYRHGRCEACRWYWNTHGVERPTGLG